MPLAHTVSNEVVLNAVGQELKFGGELYSSDIVVLSVAGPFVGTLQFENSLNGIDWFPIGMFPTDGGGGTGNNPAVTSTTAPGCFVTRWCPYLLRFRVSALSSGSIRLTTNKISQK